MESEKTAKNIDSFFELIKWMELQPEIKYPSVRLEPVECGIVARATWVAIDGEQCGKQCAIDYVMPRHCDFLEPQSVEGHAARYMAQKMIQSWTD